MSSINREKLAKNMREFALKKPGFEIKDYGGNFEAYMSDYNSYKEDADFNRNFSEQQLLEILNNNTDEEIRDAFKTAYSGRLSFDENMELHYCAGQYFPTEYQAALRSVIEHLMGR